MNPNNSVDYNNFWVAIPVFNNAATVLQIVRQVLTIWPNVVVVDDGSTDVSLSALLKDTNACIIRHDTNLGKGRAILTAARFIAGKNARYMLTIDADGQHHPKDILLFTCKLNQTPDSEKVFIGIRDFSSPNIPSSSRFGRDFSNYWVYMETGIDLKDTQSGMRVYPVNMLLGLKLKSHAYDFEIEALVKLIWAGVEAECVPISVYYPEPQLRISHFKPIIDNARISLVHMRLIIQKLFFSLKYPERVLIKQNC